MSEVNVVATLQEGSIKLNYDEVKVALSEKLKEFQGLVFDDNNIDYAKKIIASLRADKKDLDSKRISLKKECMKPFEDVEPKLKELIAMFDTPIDFMSEQVLGFEEKCKAEKNIKIRESYYFLASELMEIIPLEKIYNTKWENKTTTMASIESDISAMVTKVNTDLLAIKTMKSDAEERAINTYKSSLDLGQAMKTIADYEEQKAEIVRRQQEQELEKARAEERKRVAEEQQIIEQAKEEVRQESAFEEFKQAEALKLDEANAYADTVRSLFTITATPKELDQVEMYLDSLGITFERNDF